MMRTLIFALALGTLSGPALAQQVSDPGRNAYQELLAEANNRLVNMAVEAQRMKEELAKAKDDLAKAQAPEKK